MPWQKPWNGESNRYLKLPKNGYTGDKYEGINIVLLLGSALKQNFSTNEWATFNQWSNRNEFIRKGEKGTMIVFCGKMKKEVDGEIEEIPFLKKSIVFNQCQLASYTPTTIEHEPSTPSLVQSVEAIDIFVTNTKAIIEHKPNEGAYYTPTMDKIVMPPQSAFVNTASSTATENYYSTLFHELTHWTGSSKRLNRISHKKFGDTSYANEELVAELGAAFLCAEFQIAAKENTSHAAYIDHWLKVLKQDNRFIITAASKAWKAITYMHTLS